MTRPARQQARRVAKRREAAGERAGVLRSPPSPAALSAVRRAARAAAGAALGLALACAFTFALSAPGQALAAPAAEAPAAAANAVPPSAASRPATVAIRGRVVRVHDGDSLLLRIEGEGVHGVRIAGIDAPEKGQPYADVSRRALLAQLDDREIRVEVVKTDFFGRLVGRVFVEGRDAGLAQLRAGLAWHFRRYDADLAPAQRRRYAEAERQARLRRLGLWREAAPVPPWEYRAQARRSHSPASAPRIDPRAAQ